MLRVAIALCLLLSSHSVAHAQKRVALVIGNSAYQHTGHLTNPRNDASDVGAAFKKLGFQVLEGTDLDKAAFGRKLIEFAEALDGGATGVFFYAGHGLQVLGKNYLVPVDARLKTAASIQFELIKLEDVQQLMEGLTKSNIIFLDACRNNPLTRNLSAAMGTRSTQIGQGLAETKAGVGTLISFSTQPDNVALDGTGRNSPFTGPLVTHVLSSKEDLSGVLIAVRNDVMKATDDKQVPWEHSALRARFYFFSQPAAPISTSSIVVSNSEAAEAWDRIKESSNIAILEAFIARFKDTFLAELARNRLEDLRKSPASPRESMAPPPAPQAVADPPAPTPIGASHRVLTGAENLRKSNFARLAGKRVGLITNQTGLVGPEGHLADLLHSAKILAAIFVPEHGWEGRAGAGEKVLTRQDHATGVPIHSLYGDTRKPTREMLKNIDVLVFDVQDIGVRFYTYISTLGLAMQAAAAERIPFIILDRPNPLGGEYVSGFLLEDSLRSFVGQYTIPIVHGMTVGELGRMIAKKKLLPGLDNLDLSVEPMSGWERWMRWPDHSGPWITTSPAINTFEAALLYPGMGLLESTSLVNDGRGTNQPFRLLGTEWLDATAMAARLNAQNLAGLTFEPTEYTPQARAGTITNTRLAGSALSGVRVRVTDYKVVEPLELGIVVLQLLREQARGKGEPELIDQPSWLSRLAGTKRLYDQLKQGATAAKIKASWKEEVEKFKLSRAPFLLYK